MDEAKLVLVITRFIYQLLGQVVGAEYDWIVFATILTLFHDCRLVNAANDEVVWREGEAEIGFIYDCNLFLSLINNKNILDFLYLLIEYLIHEVLHIFKYVFLVFDGVRGDDGDERDEGEGNHDHARPLPHLAKLVLHF